MAKTGSAPESKSIARRLWEPKSRVQESKEPEVTVLPGSRAYNKQIQRLYEGKITFEQFSEMVRSSISRHL